jgi:hypothetical protein
MDSQISRVRFRAVILPDRGGLVAIVVPTATIASRSAAFGAPEVSAGWKAAAGPFARPDNYANALMRLLPIVPLIPIPTVQRRCIDIRIGRECVRLVGEGPGSKQPLVDAVAVGERRDWAKNLIRETDHHLGRRRVEHQCPLQHGNALRATGANPELRGAF